MKHPLCRRNIWIELLGFDNTQDDFGVAAYFQRLGFVPPVVSFLITSPDIVHHHEGLETEVVFPPDYCSYIGHARNAERRRQAWTNHQLRGLIQALQSHGAQVFLATFTFFLGDEFHHEWVSDHTELLEVRKNGEAVNALSPIKRLKDGTFYEDFFIPKLARVLSDYGFDGWQAADGWGPLRLPIYESDFSDDMCTQFLSTQNIEVPREITESCDNDEAKLQARADWILSTQRRAWIDFHVARWEDFYIKKVAALRAVGKRVVINSSWTRDPFEALFRYGISYQKLIAAGVEGIVTESLAGACDMQANDGGYRRHDYVGALMLTRAAVPDAQLWFLLGIKDTKEQWDVLRHTPTVFESELFALASIYASTQNGWRRCADGFLACLADGLRDYEWRFMARLWEMAFDEAPARILGATLLWSDRAFENELDDFIEHRSATTHRLLHRLTERGAPLYSVARLEHLETLRGPLLVLNAHLWPDEEWQRVLSYRGGDVLAVRRTDEDKLALQIFREDGNDGETLANSSLTPRNELDESEPMSFLYDLPMRLPRDDFFASAAAQIIEVCDAPRIMVGERPVGVEHLTTDEGLTGVQAIETARGELRVLISNRALTYAMPRVDVRRAIESIEVMSDFPSADVPFEGSEFSVKVPARGCTLLRVLTKGNQ